VGGVKGGGKFGHVVELEYWEERGRERVVLGRLVQLKEHQVEKRVCRREEIGNWEWAAVFWIRKRPRAKGAAAEA